MFYDAFFSIFHKPRQNQITHYIEQTRPLHDSPLPNSATYRDTCCCQYRLMMPFGPGFGDAPWLDLSEM